MTLELLFNYMGVRLNGPEAAATPLRLNLNVTDTGETAVLELTNGSLNHSLGRHDSDADVTLTMERSVLSAVVLGELSTADAVAKGILTADPGTEALDTLLRHLDSFDFWFNIVEP
jgi:alkyl sulfatase BDS1-like metallo-beta-lactamase superfamily hydrolase